jgi:transcriptional regulator with XRE-family HTH domain
LREQLRDARLAAGLSEAHLGALLETPIAVRAIRCYEAGDVLWRVHWIVDCAQVLGVRADAWLRSARPTPVASPPCPVMTVDTALVAGLMADDRVAEWAAAEAQAGRRHVTLGLPAMVELARRCRVDVSLLATMLDALRRAASEPASAGVGQQLPHEKRFRAAQQRAAHHGRAWRKTPTGAPASAVPLGEYLRTARLITGMTQYQLGQLLTPTLTPGQVSRWESGHTLVSVSRLLELEQALGFDAADVLGWVQNRVRPRPVTPFRVDLADVLTGQFSTYIRLQSWARHRVKTGHQSAELDTATVTELARDWQLGVWGLLVMLRSHLIPAQSRTGARG